MILVTVGTQLPFDRLVKAVDLWHENNIDEQVIYQIGEGLYKPKSGEVYDYIKADLLDEIQKNADLVVGHAGIGTIISRLSINKPILIMARRFSLKEHRNDHQVATLKKFKDCKNIFIAENEHELSQKIDFALKAEKCINDLDDKNLSMLINNLKKYFTR